MKEIEVKILEVDQGAVIRKLEQMGARKVFDGEIVASYFDFQDGRLANEDKLLRLRKKGGGCELTFKKTIEKEKVRFMEEHEVRLGDDDAYEVMTTILDGIQLKEFKRLTKHRLSFVLDRIHFELDTYPGIPPFLEIEATDSESIPQWVARLGFSMRDAKPWSVRDVLDYYQKQKRNHA